MATLDQNSIEDLNALLRGEISAAETYKMAMDKIGGDMHRFDVQVDQLHEIQRDHGMAAQRLRQRIESLGGQADDASGAWGAWARTVQGAADLFGNSSALKALKEGEEHGIDSYERKLDEDHLDPVSRSLAMEIANQEQQHVAVLDRMMNVVRS